MTTLIRDLMSAPIKLRSSAPIIDAARQMKREGIGAIVVQDDSGKTCGIVTDRDITVRAVAEGMDPKSTRLSEVCTPHLETVAPDDSIDRAIDLMRRKAIRRLLVVDGEDKTVGVLSLGDLAIERDFGSVLGQISAAPATV